MLKLFNDFAKALFAERLKAVYPEYKHKKSLRGPLPGAANFEFKVDRSRTAWICFSGFKDAEFTVFSAWSNLGKELKSLPEWEQYGNPNAFQVPPAPADGYVDLRDRWRFEDSSAGGAWYALDIGSPPRDFALKIFESYVATPAWEEHVQRHYRGAQRIYTKNMPSMEEVRSNCLVAERAYCKSLWSHLAERHLFSDDELLALLEPVVQRALDLVQRHGHPHVLRQLGCS